MKVNWTTHTSLNHQTFSQLLELKLPPKTDVNGSLSPTLIPNLELLLLKSSTWIEGIQALQ